MAIHEVSIDSLSRRKKYRFFHYGTTIQCSMHFSYSTFMLLIKSLSLYCCLRLVFNHPRSEGWSLHGQVYSISFCPLSPSVVFQTTAYLSILSIHHIFGLPCFLAPGNS